MPKKTFKDNPALQFISTPNDDENQDQETESIPAKVPKGYKLNPLYIETKSRRLQLVLQPSLYDRVKAKAKANGLSVNEYCHQILDEATKGE